MDLQEIIQQETFALAGDTLNEEKYAYKELAGFNDIPDDIDIIDLCINPVKGLSLIKECTRPFKCIVIQPGAESDELLAYLDEKKLPYIQGCLLVGLSLYAKDKKKAQS